MLIVSKMTGKPRHGHGIRRTQVYDAWVDMRQRCQNPRAKYYHHYGGRGIAVCDRWQIFENFLTDMGEPAPGLTLERRENDEGYSKANCYWATRAEQGRNRRSTVLTADLREQIRTLARTGLGNRRIAAKLNVGRGAVNGFLRGVTWS